MNNLSFRSFWLNIGIKSVLFAFTLILLLSCDKLSYTTNANNIEKITKVEPTVNDLVVKLEDITTDTINIWGTTNFVYTPDVKDKELSDTKVFLDDSLIYSSSYNFSFRFDSEEFLDGYRKLKFEVYAYSNEKSLANYTLREILTTSRQYILNIDNAPPNPIEIMKIDTVDNVIELTWESYRRFNFQEYRIYANPYDSHDAFEQLLVTITSQDQTKFKISTYLGGQRFYRIEIKAADKIEEGIYKKCNFPVPEITSISIEEDSLVILNWTPTYFKNAFEHYNIYRTIGAHDDSYVTWEKVTGLTNPEKNHFSEPIIGFGDKISYKLVTYPKHRFGYQKTCYSNTIYKGRSIGNFDELHYVKDTDNYYLQKYSSWIKKLNGSTLNEEITVTINNRFTISHYGNRAMASGDTYELLEIDPISLQSKSTYDSRNIVGYDSRVGRPYPVSDNFCYYTSYIYNNPTVYGDAWFLIDLNQKTVIDRRTYNNGQDWPPRFNYMNHDGKFVVLTGINTVLYEMVDGIYTSKREILREQAFCFYNEKNAYIISDMKSIRIYNNINDELLKEISTDDDFSDITIDPATEYLGAVSKNENKYYIYDLEEGTLIKTINLLDKYKLYLLKDRLFCGNGYYLDLNL